MWYCIILSDSFPVSGSITGNATNFVWLEWSNSPYVVKSGSKTVTRNIFPCPGCNFNLNIPSCQTTVSIL
jgi:hypothetical protein